MYVCMCKYIIIKARATRDQVSVFVHMYVHLLKCLYVNLEFRQFRSLSPTFISFHSTLKICRFFFLILPNFSDTLRPPSQRQFRQPEEC